MLAQIADRGETGIVYDPALENVPQFHRESRGDVLLNPLTACCPFWMPGDEMPHEAGALTVAAVFAHLIQSETDTGAGRLEISMGLVLDDDVPRALQQLHTAFFSDLDPAVIA